MSEENKTHFVSLSLDRPLLLINMVKLRAKGYTHIEVPPGSRAYLIGVTSKPMKIEDGSYKVPQDIKLIVAYLDNLFNITLQFSTLTQEKVRAKLEMKVYDPSLLARWWLSNEDHIYTIEMDLFDVLELSTIPLLSGKREADKFAIIDFFRNFGIGIHDIIWIETETVAQDPLAIVKSAAEKIKEKLMEVEQPSPFESKKLLEVGNEQEDLLQSIPPPPPFNPIEEETIPSPPSPENKKETESIIPAEKIKKVLEGDTISSSEKIVSEENESIEHIKEIEEEELMPSEYTVEQISNIPVITEKTKEKPIHRHVEINYYKIMRLGKTYPLRTKISTSKLEEKTKRPFFVEKVEEIVEFEPDTDLVEVKLIMPGCLVNPSSITVDIREELVDNLFYITPLSTGVFNGVLEIWKEGKRAAIVELPFRTMSIAPAKLSALTGVITSLPVILKPFGVNLESKLDTAFKTAFNLTKPITGVLSIVLSSILFIGASTYYFVYSKEKQAYKDAFMT